MPNRYKPVGWRGEPHRHYLAAKGIKTKNFDLDKYKGRYEQKAVHNEPWFQRDCDKVFAEYTDSPDADISVRNVCVDDGEVREVTGTANKMEDGLLEVDFGLFRKGDYEIVAVTPDYENAIVKSGDTVWVLEKTDEDKYFMHKDDSLRLYRGVSAEEVAALRDAGDVVDSSESQYGIDKAFFTTDRKEAEKYGDNIIAVDVPLDAERTQIQGAPFTRQAEKVEGNVWLVDDGTPVKYFAVKNLLNQKRKPTKKQLYDNFIESLAVAEDENGNPIGEKRAREMYSMEEYVSGGAYDQDIGTWEFNKFKREQS